MDFIIGGIAGVGATIFSNPFDLVKTRMQLQGELRKKGQHAVHYRNTLHAIINIVKHDGIWSLQQGLAAAMYFSWVVNAVRLGLYDVTNRLNLIRDKDGNTKFINSWLSSAFGGAVGGVVGSPFQLIKTQQMSMSSQKIAVGTQHDHSGVFYGLKRIYDKDGVQGLFRGAHGMVVRNSVATAFQISVYEISKEWLVSNKTFQQSKYLQVFAASNVSAVVKTAVLTPMDVVMTRIFNQSVDEKGRGQLYSGLMDCTRKIISTEGLSAFYKGLGPSYLRQAPHTVLVLVFWDYLKDLQKSFQK